MFIFFPSIVLLCMWYQLHTLTMWKYVLALSNLVSAIKSKTRINLNSHCQVDEYYVVTGAKTLLVVFWKISG